MPAGVPVIPDGSAAIVRKIHGQYAIIMEHGAGQVVTVIPTGAAAIAQLKMLVAGMDGGTIP